MWRSGGARLQGRRVDWNSPYIEKLIRAALTENAETDDVWLAASIPAQAQGKAHIIASQDLICAGLPLVERIYRSFDAEMKVELEVEEGREVIAGAEILHLDGAAAAIIMGERTALNFLRRLSGIATLTQQFVKKIDGTRAKISATLKTTPGMEFLEKYAVQTGGGTGHRIKPSILLTESHIALAGGVTAALDQAHSFASTQMKLPAMTAYESVGVTPSEVEASSLLVQIEVQNAGELRDALSAGAEAVLFASMPLEQAREYVAIVREVRPDCIVEISGTIPLVNVRAYAETGADLLSPDELIRSAPYGEFRLLVDSVE
jgi:nicotinate-nucleotide pyrophosphorylase (carboxylating)